MIAHDQAGTLIADGLLAPVDLGDKAADFNPNAVAACTFDGQVYCMPYATENLGFFYNTDLVQLLPLLGMRSSPWVKPSRLKARLSM